MPSSGLALARSQCQLDRRHPGGAGTTWSATMLMSNLLVASFASALGGRMAAWSSANAKSATDGSVWADQKRRNFCCQVMRLCRLSGLAKAGRSRLRAIILLPEPKDRAAQELVTTIQRMLVMHVQTFNDERVCAHAAQTNRSR